MNGWLTISVSSRGASLSTFAGSHALAADEKRMDEFARAFDS